MFVLVLVLLVLLVEFMLCFVDVVVVLFFVGVVVVLVCEEVLFVVGMFVVVVLVDGRSENFNTSSMGDRSLVEFYDRRYDFTPDGPFTGHRLNLDTALEASQYVMDYNVEAWSMDTRTSRTVRDWLYFLVDRDCVRV